MSILLNLCFGNSSKEYSLRHLEVFKTISILPRLTDFIFPSPPSPNSARSPASSPPSTTSILAAFDDKTDLNRRMNAALEATGRALFQSWFVDFDPVRAKAEGRAPEGMDAATAALFPDSFEDSALAQWVAGGTLG